MSPASRALKSYTPLSKKLTGSIGQITGVIEDNAKLMDTVQELAIQLTHAMGTLHTLTVKYAGTANSILDVLSPLMGSLPLIPKRAKDVLGDLEHLTQRVVDTQASTSRTIADVQLGLTTADVTRLRGHVGELQSMTKSLLSVLPK
jgi:ABC-type transporter Mla subunit MlaD